MCVEVLCVQYKNNTYVANEKVTWHLSFYYKYFIKIVATFSVLIELDFIYSHDKNKEKIKKRWLKTVHFFVNQNKKGVNIILVLTCLGHGQFGPYIFIAVNLVPTFFNLQLVWSLPLSH